MLKKLGAFKIGGIAINELTTAYDPNALGSNKPFLWINDTDSFPDDGQGNSLYKEIFSTNVPDVAVGLYGENNASGYKQNRDFIKDVVEVVGFDNLSLSNQVLAAKMNIGTGAQILAAIPNDDERDESSYEYLKATKGYSTGERQERALRTEALIWSRLKHLSITPVGYPFPVGVPEYILGLTVIANATPVPGEINGKLLELYTSLGIQGFILGDLTLGLGDFIQETPNTRYSPANGGGLRTESNISSLIPAGMADMNELADKLYDVWQYGNY